MRKRRIAIRLAAVSVFLLLILCAASCGKKPSETEALTESAAESRESTAEEPAESQWAGETESETTAPQTLPTLPEATPEEPESEERSSEDVPSTEEVPPSAEPVTEESMPEEESSEEETVPLPRIVSGVTGYETRPETEPETETETQPPPPPPETKPPEQTFREVTEENLEAYCRYRVAKYNLDSPRAIYLHMFNFFSYRYRDKLGSDKAMAARLFNNGSGPCYDIANATAYLLRAAGYRCYVVQGISRSNAGEHNWVLVEMSPGVWRYMDTLWGRAPLYNLTDEELQAYDNQMGMSFIWDTSLFTTHSSTGLGSGWGDKTPPSP